MSEFKVGDRVYFLYDMGEEEGYGTIVDTTSYGPLIGVETDEKLTSVRHNCCGAAKDGHGIWLEKDQMNHVDPPAPMEIVNQFYETTKTKTPFDIQVGGGHYKSMSIQPVEFILANELGFCEGNIIKYTCRYKQKGGIQDLKKVIHYAEMLIADIENKA